MKTYTLLLALLLCFGLGNVFAQETDKKSEQPIETDISRIEGVLQSQNFEFIANTMYPLSGSPKNLVGSGYSVTFSPENIISNLPFYGRAYSGMIMGKDKGMRFQGKPEDFKFEKQKEYEISTLVNDGDIYKLFLSVGKSGYATLSISSNNRGTITYRGEVVKVSK